MEIGLIYKQYTSTFKDTKNRNTKEIWKLLKNATTGGVKGNLKMDLNKVAEHFEKLSTDPNIGEGESEERVGEGIGEQPETNNTFNEPFTENEVRKLIDDLKNGKACGLDFIRNEFLKNISDRLLTALTRMFNVVLKSGIVPDAWCMGAIIPLYKGKGSKDELDIYRA